MNCSTAATGLSKNLSIQELEKLVVNIAKRMCPPEYQKVILIRKDNGTTLDIRYKNRPDSGLNLFLHKNTVTSDFRPFGPNVVIGDILLKELVMEYGGEVVIFDMQTCFTYNKDTKQWVEKELEDE